MAEAGPRSAGGVAPCRLRHEGHGHDVAKGGATAMIATIPATTGTEIATTAGASAAAIGIVIASGAVIERIEPRRTVIERTEIGPRGTPNLPRL